MKIFGSKWPTPDGTCIRDYVHVMDLVEGHLYAMKYLLKNNAQNITINLGSGEGTSIFQLVNKFSEVNKVSIPIKYCDVREGDVASLVTDNSLAKDMLSWEPKRTMEDICKDSWNWKLKN